MAVNGNLVIAPSSSDVITAMLNERTGGRQILAYAQCSKIAADAFNSQWSIHNITVPVVERE